MKQLQKTLSVLSSPLVTGELPTSIVLLRAGSLCLLLCPALCAWLFSLHLVALVPTGAWILPVATLLSATIALLLCRSRPLPALAGIGLALALLTFAYLLASYHFAPVFDAAAYHYPAAILMSEGWNPLWNYIEPQMEAIRCYPKTQWYISAASYLLSGKISSGNWTNLVFICITGSIAYELARLKANFPNWLAILFAMAVMLNPVSILQNQSGYLDGIVGSNIAIFVLASLCFQYRGEKYYLVLLGISFMFAATTKTTGLLFLSLLAACLALISIRHHFHRVKTSLLAIFITLIFFNPLWINPYFYNALEHGNPFHPVFAAKEESTIAAHRFEELQLNPDDRVYNFFHTQIFTNGLHSKKPKTWTAERFDYSILTPPMQNGGFGPLFGPVFLLGLALTVLLAFKRAYWEAAFCLSIALCIFISPATIIARYHAHVWLLPVMASFFLMQRGVFALPSFGISIVLLVTMTINSLMISYVIAVKNVSETMLWRKKMEVLNKEKKKKKILLYGVFKKPFTLHSDFYKTVLRDETGIELHAISEQSPPPGVRKWFAKNRKIVFYLASGETADSSKP